MRTKSLAALLVVAAVLYLARDVLIPLAAAILLAFLLVPAGDRPRFPAEAPLDARKLQPIASRARGA